MKWQRHATHTMCPPCGLQQVFFYKSTNPNKVRFIYTYSKYLALDYGVKHQEFGSLAGAIKHASGK